MHTGKERKKKQVSLSEAKGISHVRKQEWGEVWGRGEGGWEPGLEEVHILKSGRRGETKRREKGIAWKVREARRVCGRECMEEYEYIYAVFSI